MSALPLETVPLRINWGQNPIKSGASKTDLVQTVIDLQIDALHVGK